MHNNPTIDSPESAISNKDKDFLITKKEAARRLAISVRTLDRLVVRGSIEKIFLGSSVRFRERDIASLIENGA